MPKPETPMQTALALRTRVECCIWREFGEDADEMRRFRQAWNATAGWKQRAELCASWMRRLTAIEDLRRSPLDI